MDRQDVAIFSPCLRYLELILQAREKFSRRCTFHSVLFHLLTYLECTFWELIRFYLLDVLSLFLIFSLLK